MTNIDRIVASINKELKTNLVVGDDEALDTLRIPTGMPALDQMLGGGVPRQAVTELFGYQSSGKTYISQRIIAHAQTLGYTCGFIDAEFSYDPEWSSNVGINTHDLIVSRPDTGEVALDVLLKLCEQGVDIVVLDSIAALLPTAEAKEGMDHLSIGLQARLMNQLFRKLAPSNEKTAVILINQIRAGIGGYITRDALPGGKGQEFFSRIMVRVRKGETIGDQKSPQGFFIEMKAEKNKTHTPLLTSSVPFYYTGLPDPIYEAFMMASDLGIVVRSGPQYAYPDKETGEVVYKALGREKFLQLMKDNDGLRTSIEAEIRSME
jgi:recombination protein RecA|tara:strand:+ start:5401 stop:6363 length:963 start_codon:yes stop_codon:yes gene_type:complete